MKSYKVKIKGLSPYMQHRMDDQKLEAWEKLRGKIMAIVTKAVSATYPPIRYAVR